MFHFFMDSRKNKQLDAMLQRIEMNVSNNYKDAAQSGLKDFETELRRLEDDGEIKEKSKDYYEERLLSLKEQMKNFTHKDQKPTWV